MKIRRGFVSNSSSSSFVCIIPKDWNPTEAAIIKAAADYIEEGSENEILDDVRNKIEHLKSDNGYTVWIEDEESEAGPVLDDLIPDTFKIASWDSGPDDGRIISPNLKKVRKLI